MSGSCACDEEKGQYCVFCAPAGIPLEVLRRHSHVTSTLEAEHQAGPQRIDGWALQSSRVSALPKHGEGVKQPRHVSGKVRQMISELPNKAVVTHGPGITSAESEETLAEALCNPREVYSQPAPMPPLQEAASNNGHILTGDGHAAYMEFRAAARELRAAGEILRAAQERYKAALERHSEAACKDEP